MYTVRLLFKSPLSITVTRRLWKFMPPTASASPSARGCDSLRAKEQRRAKELHKDLIAGRLEALAAEEARILAVIALTKEKTREREQIAERARASQRAKEQASKWIQAEQDERRQMINESRQQSREAVTRRRLALLEQRQADFLAKKQEAREARAAIEAARALKLEQVRAAKHHVNESHQQARKRAEIRQRNKTESMRIQSQIPQRKEAAECRANERALARLAAEEERLLSSVLKLHSDHHQAFHRLQQRVPGFRTGLIRSAAPLSLPTPTPPDSPLLSRRPMSASSRPFTPQRPWAAERSSTASPRRTCRNQYGLFGSSPAATRPSADHVQASPLELDKMPMTCEHICTMPMVHSRPSSARY